MASRGRPAPRYKIPNIVSYLEKTLGISLKEADLQKPTDKTMKRIFEKLVEDYSGSLKADQFLNESFSFMLDVDEESLQKFAFHGAVFEMMRMAGVEDFGVKDIYSPEPGRTTLLLSAAISFHKHRSQNEGSYLKEATARINPIFEQLNELRLEIDEMETVVMAFNDKCAQEQDQVDAVEVKLREMGVDARKLQVQRQTMLEDRDAFQKDLNNQEEEVNKARAAVAEAKEEGVKLRQQIVESPERLQSSLEELTEQIESSEAFKEALKQEVEALAQKKAHTAKAARKVAKVSKLLENIDAALQSYKEKRAKVKAKQEQLTATKLAVATLHAQQETDQLAVRDKMEQKRQGQAECIERESLAKQEVDMRTLEMQRVQQGADMHLVRVSNKDHEIKSMIDMEDAASAEHSKRRARRQGLSQEAFKAIEERKVMLQKVDEMGPPRMPSASPLKVLNI